MATTGRAAAVLAAGLLGLVGCSSGADDGALFGSSGAPAARVVESDSGAGGAAPAEPDSGAPVASGGSGAGGAPIGAGGTTGSGGAQGAGGRRPSVSGGAPTIQAGGAAATGGAPGTGGMVGAGGLVGSGGFVSVYTGGKPGAGGAPACDPAIQCAANRCSGMVNCGNGAVLDCAKATHCGTNEYCSGPTVAGYCASFLDGLGCEGGDGPVLVTVRNSPSANYSYHCKVAPTDNPYCSVSPTAQNPDYWDCSYYCHRDPSASAYWLCK